MGAARSLPRLSRIDDVLEVELDAVAVGAVPFCEPLGDFELCQLALHSSFERPKPHSQFTFFNIEFSFLIFSHVASASTLKAKTVKPMTKHVVA